MGERKVFCRKAKMSVTVSLGQQTQEIKEKVDHIFCQSRWCELVENK
jgi:hypothetical protein